MAFSSLFSFFFFSFLSLSSCYLIPSHYSALYSFYNSTNGQNWTSTCKSTGWQFVVKADPCIQQWSGIKCEPTTCTPSIPCYLSSISLSNCNLNGEIPIEIYNVSTLSALTLSSNSIRGSIPNEIKNLKTLTTFDLAVNKLTGTLPQQIPSGIYTFSVRRNSLEGTIPKTLTLATNLISLDLRTNKFHGTIPQNISLISILVALLLDHNQLTGPIPPKVNSNMQLFQLSNNSLSGSLPLNLCSVCSIVTLDFSKNNLTGSIPPETFQLMKSLSTFNLSFNSLTGEIPSTFASLSRLSSVDMSMNRLTGSLITSYFSAKTLKGLNLFSNHLSGHVDFELFKATQLTALALQNNHFSGPIQFNSNSRYLTILDLSSNFFTSSLPETFSVITLLQQLHLQDNFLTSSIPRALSTRPYLRLLDLSYNYLTGTIPPYLFNSSTAYPTWSILLNLYLHGNYFTGTIPTNICRALLLRQVSLFHNFLTGTIPQLENCASIQTILLQGNLLSGDPGKAFEKTGNDMKYTNFSLLQAIDLSDNHFSGTIPHQIFNLPRIVYVAIVGGCFQSRLPDEICNATTLETLVLEGLRSGQKCREEIWDPLDIIYSKVYRTSTVKGSIPACIWNLTNLKTLYLSGNLIEGTIPSPKSLPPSLKELSLSYNQLTGTIPRALQDHSFDYFDLQHNRLTGTSEEIHLGHEKNNKTHITLSVNRLSGRIQNLNSLVNVDVLSGNIYSCRHREDLPENDPESTTYICASDALDLTLIFWFMLIFVFLICVVGALYMIKYRRRISSSFSEGGFQNSFFGLSLIRTPSIDSDKSTCENPLNQLRESNQSENNQENNQLDQTPVWEQMTDKIHLISEYYNEITQINTNTNPELKKFLSTISHLRTFALRTTIIAITIFLGFYLVMKVTFRAGTHQHQYRWLFSAAFITNQYAAMVLLIFIAIILFYFVHSIIEMTSQSEAVRTRSRSWRSSSLGLSMIELSSSPNVPNFENNPATTIGGTESNGLILTVDQLTTTEDMIFSSSHSYTTSAMIASYLFIFTVVLCNILIVLIVKGSYVYAVIWLSLEPIEKVFLQLALSFFDITWNTFLITRILIIFPSLMRSKVRVKLHLTLLIFNSIVAPIIATALTDRNCFVDIFQLNETINSSGSYILCDAIDTNKYNCLSTSSVTLSTSFSPPYSYSYQCSSAVLVNFVPVFIITYSFLTFVQPILLFVLVYFISNSNTLSSALHVLPSILWPHKAHKYELKKVILANPIVSGLLHHTVVLLTFGLASPFLGVVITIAICMITLQWEFIIGRYLNLRKRREIEKKTNPLPRSPLTHISPLPSPPISISTQQHMTDFKIALENACVGVWMGPMKSVYTMVDVVCVVYSILFFDMAGDQIGGFRAFKILSIPTICLPIVIRLFYRTIYPKLIVEKLKGRPKSVSRAEDIQVHVVEESTTRTMSQTERSSGGSMFSGRILSYFRSSGGSTGTDTGSPTKHSLDEHHMSIESPSDGMKSVELSSSYDTRTFLT